MALSRLQAFAWWLAKKHKGSTRPSSGRSSYNIIAGEEGGGSAKGKKAERRDDIEVDFPTLCRSSTLSFCPLTVRHNWVLLMIFRDWMSERRGA